MKRLILFLVLVIGVSLNASSQGLSSAHEVYFAVGSSAINSDTKATLNNFCFKVLNLLCLYSSHKAKDDNYNPKQSRNLTVDCCFVCHTSHAKRPSFCTQSKDHSFSD